MYPEGGGPCAVIPPRVYKPTGRHRLASHGDLVVLQIEEKTSYPAMPDVRWRNAAPQDVMSMVNVKMMSSVLRAGG